MRAAPASTSSARSSTVSGREPKIAFVRASYHHPDRVLSAHGGFNDREPPSGPPPPKRIEQAEAGGEVGVAVGVEGVPPWAGGQGSRINVKVCVKTVGLTLPPGYC